MAQKKKQAAKSLAKKDMKKTKGGIIAVRPGGAVQQDISFSTSFDKKIVPGAINAADGSV